MVRLGRGMAAKRLAARLTFSSTGCFSAAFVFFDLSACFDAFVALGAGAVSETSTFRDFVAFGVVSMTAAVAFDDFAVAADFFTVDGAAEVGFAGFRVDFSSSETFFDAF
jgi:hypothetical protein